MSGVNREPAIRQRPPHPAENLPERSPAPHPSPVQPAPVAPAAEVGEKLSEQHNVRIRPSTKQRITRGVDKLRYESGDRSISIASITDAAIDEYLTKRGC